MMINNVSRHLTSRQPVKGNFGKKNILLQYQQYLLDDIL